MVRLKRVNIWQQSLINLELFLEEGAMKVHKNIEIVLWDSFKGIIGLKIMISAISFKANVYYGTRVVLNYFDSIRRVIKND